VLVVVKVTQHCRLGIVMDLLVKLVEHERRGGRLRYCETRLVAFRSMPGQDERVAQVRVRLKAAAEVTSYAGLAGGLGLLTALIVGMRGWPVAARVAAGLVPAAAGVAVPFLMTDLYIMFGVDDPGRLRRPRRLDNPTLSPLYDRVGVAALTGVQGFGAALGAGWRQGWVGWAAACVAVLVWGLAGVGLIPLPGRARRLSLESWVRRLRVRYRRRSRQLVVAAVVWWPRHPSYRAVLRATGGECEAGDGAGRPAGQLPRVERVRQLPRTMPR
jgi:hypothetical protein